MKNILIIGGGGIGSYLIENICKKIEQEQIDNFTQITIADNDTTEIDQLVYQNFRLKDAGKNKAQALAERFKEYGVKEIKRRINANDIWKGKYDIVLLCVDNDQTREIVVNACYKHKIEFLDLRATGRRIFAMPKTTLQENLKFIDSNDKQEYSCQEKEDLENGLYQMGNEIVAKIGTQMLLNLLRGHDNRIINMVV